MLSYYVDINSPHYQHRLRDLYFLQAPEHEGTHLMLWVSWSQFSSGADVVPDVIPYIPSWAKDVTIVLNYATTDRPVPLPKDALSKLSKRIKEKDFHSLQIQNLNVWNFWTYKYHEAYSYADYPEQYIDTIVNDMPCDVLEDYFASLPASDTMNLSNVPLSLSFKQHDFERIFAAMPKAKVIHLNKSVHVQDQWIDREYSSVKGMWELSFRPKQFELLVQHLEKEGKIELLKGVTLEDYRELMFSQEEIDALKNALPSELADSKWYTDARRCIKRNPIVTFNPDCFKAVPERIKTIDFSENKLQYMSVDHLGALNNSLPHLKTMVVSASEIEDMTQEQRQALMKIAPVVQFVTEDGEHNQIIQEMNLSIQRQNAQEVNVKAKIIAEKSISEDTALAVMSFLKRKTFIQKAIDEKIESTKESNKKPKG